jgi:drug/metabolite transporter (DMT)-like permease
VAALFFSDERLTPRKIIGVVLGFFGVATAIGLENLQNFDLLSLAQLAVIGGTVAYAVAGVWARKKLVGMPPQLAAAGMLTGATIIMLPLAYFVEGPPTFDLQLRTLFAIGYYAVIATAAAYLLYYRVLAMAGSGNLMLVTLLVAPVAITLGAVVLGEKLAVNAFMGFAILAVGLIILDGRAWKALSG